MVPHALNTTDPTALCIAGQTPFVHAYVNPKPSKVWVVLLGATSVGLNLCISEDHCALWGKQPLAPGVPPPPPPQPPPPLPLQGGPQSLDCSINPDWCEANHAQIPLCDATLGLSNLSAIVTAKGCPIAGTCCAKPQMWFRGRRVLAAAVRRLGALGLSGATDVVLLGVGWGGTAAILNADFLHEQVKAVALSLVRFKVLAVDGIHPQHIPDPASSFTPAIGPKLWLADALTNIETLASLSSAASPACLVAHASDPSSCLWPATALAHIAAPVFVVQEFPAVWDTQCEFDGGESSGILQVQCSSRDALYDCAQYSDLCPKQIVQDFFLPVQKAYVNETTASGLPTRAGSGGFYHGCFLGAYFFGSHQTNYSQCYPPPCNGTRVVGKLTGIWNQISVAGVTMQAAISRWWRGAVSAAPVWYLDSYWNPSGTPPPNVPPPSPTTMEEQEDDASPAARKRTNTRRVGRRRAPPAVPWYVSRYFTNPSCRGFPWY